MNARVKMVRVVQDLTGVELVRDATTAAYCCLLTSDGELMFGVGDAASHQLIRPQYVSVLRP